MDEVSSVGKVQPNPETTTKELMNELGGIMVTTGGKVKVLVCSSQSPDPRPGENLRLEFIERV